MALSVNRSLAGGIAALLLAMGIGRFAYTPLLPAMQDATGLSDEGAGVIASINLAGYLVGALALTALPDAARGLAALRLSLLASVVSTIGMAASDSIVAWTVLRLISGLASAGVFVLATAVVQRALTEARRPGLIGVHFIGVGSGIALSGATVALFGSALGWRGGWLALGGLAAVALLVAWHGLGAPLAPSTTAAPRRPAGARPAGFALMMLTAAYFCEGAGYIVTGTFLVRIARDMPALGDWAPHLWTVVGVAGAPSAMLWAWLGRRIGYLPGLIAAHLLQIVAIVLPALTPEPAAAIVAAILFGGTFMGITALTVGYAAILAPAQPARAIGMLTTVYGIGQVIGPSAAGWLAAGTGSFAAALFGAAASVAIGAVLLAIGARARH